MTTPDVHRRPAVSGRFYPERSDELVGMLDGCMPQARPDPGVGVCIGPHAGWVYSGQIYGDMLAHVEVPERVVLIGPNHTGRGARVSVWSGGSWDFPGFEVQVDDALVGALAREPGFELDRDAHLDEHCLEVQVPFLKRRQRRLRITPIVMAGLGFEACEALGHTLARVVEDAEARGGPILLAISTDMSHFESATRARQLDALALERVECMDPEGLYQVVRARGITMCGFIPTTVALVYARARGLRQCRLIRYGHSGEVSGDLHRVVGYAGLVIS